MAEGEKVVEEILSASWECVFLFSTVPNLFPKTVMINTAEMMKITHFKSPSPVLGVFKFPNAILPVTTNL